MQRKIVIFTQVVKQMFPNNIALVLLAFNVRLLREEQHSTAISFLILLRATSRSQEGKYR